MIREGVDDNGRVLTGFNYLIEIADGTDTGRQGKWTILPTCAFLIQQETANQIRSCHVLVTGHRDQWPGQVKCHVLDKA